MDSFYKLFNGEYPDQTPKNTDNEFWGSAWRIKRERNICCSIWKLHGQEENFLWK